MFGDAFGAQGTQAQIGSQAGMTYGMTLAGPAGAIVGGAIGAIGGSLVNKLAGNDDVDYDFKTSVGTEGFEDNQYISTPFGNIGFNASSTRNLSMDKMGGPILDAYAKILGPLDMQFASVLNENEMGAVRGAMEGTMENAHKWGPEYSMKMMLKDRMVAIDSTMSDERKTETGWAGMLEQYNAQYPPADRTPLAAMEEAQAKIEAYDAEVSNQTGYGSSYMKTQGEAEMAALIEQYPEMANVLDRANDSDTGYSPMGLATAGGSYYDKIDESNTRLRV